jgi:hypothetical protein
MVVNSIMLMAIFTPASVAEGVVLCGRCIGNGHTRDDEAGRATLATILEAIANG